MVPGFIYIPGFLGAAEEQELIALVETFPFHEVRMRGQVARRTVIHFGWDYDYEGWKVHPTTPPPPPLRALAGHTYEVHAHLLEPRSLYIISGEARTQWQHSIPPGKELRYSITMRILRRKAQAGAFA